MANEIGVTETASASQRVVANIVQQVLKQESILMPTVTDYSSQVGPGAKSVDIQRRTQFAAADKTENTNKTISQEKKLELETYYEQHLKPKSRIDISSLP